MLDNGDSKKHKSLNMGQQMPFVLGSEQVYDIVMEAKARKPGVYLHQQNKINNKKTLMKGPKNQGFLMNKTECAQLEAQELKQSSFQSL